MSRHANISMRMHVNKTEHKSSQAPTPQTAMLLKFQ